MIIELNEDEMNLLVQLVLTDLHNTGVALNHLRARNAANTDAFKMFSRREAGLIGLRNKLKEGNKENARNS